SALRCGGVHGHGTAPGGGEVPALAPRAALNPRRRGPLPGGQQRRGAPARPIVVRPPVLLCDEPLGALDRKLRQQMQFELKQLQKQLELTLLFVTHDQEEALAMSDRIAVMHGGQIEQGGTPADIYERPRTRFVADFIGEINIIDAEWRDGRLFGADGRTLPAPSGVKRSGKGAVAIRPECITITGPSDGLFAGRIDTANYLGGQ